jgi:hypothetical protein
LLTTYPEQNCSHGMIKSLVPKALEMSKSRFACLLLSVLILVPAVLIAQSFTFTPTTTLAQETANNTSAADTFTAQSNGNAAAGNVSKIDIHTLLYPGTTTLLYAHFMPWFGQPNHMDVGYSSNDATQVQKQVTDMLSRGIQGVVIDWYGPNFTFENSTTQLMMAEAQKHSNFVFAVMEDGGALASCANTSGCSITQQLISDLNYANSTYWISPAYMAFGGRPLVFFFGVEQYTIDWNAVRAGVQGNPVFIFENTPGFTHPQSGGAFSWVNPNPSDANDEGLGYLDNFYQTGQTTGGYIFGSAYPGFNDSLAPWMQGKTPRVMNQKCGQTWMDSLGRTANHYSTSNQLFALQLITWNDYEEGTEIESGVDDCITVSASVSGTTLNWTLGGKGKESTLDHYTVFVSTDGSNLMSLGNVPTGNYSYDLSKVGLNMGTQYTLYVKATGKASLHNQMSNGVTYTPTTSVGGTGGTGSGSGTTLQFEPEKLPYSTSGATQSILSCSCFTDGYGTQINSTGVGQSVTYTLNVPTAGTYDVRVAVKKYYTRGIWQMAVNGSNVGNTQDEYNSSALWAEFDVGNVTISSTGNQAFKFTVVGKNASSSGYTMTFDYIKLIPQNTSVPTTAAPVFSPAGGSYSGPQTVSISSATSGAAIYYTTDGTTPTTSSAKYTGPISISNTTTLMAFALASGYQASTVTSAAYNLPAGTPKAAAPIFSPLGASYSSPQTISITDATSGAVIYYTTDGTTPTTASNRYTGPFTISASTTVNAIAAASGYTNSQVTTAAYVIQVGAVTVSPTNLTFPSTNVGTTSAAQGVTLQNGTSSSVSISSVAPTGDFVMTSNSCGTSLAASASCSVFVAFRPTTTGSRTGALTFSDSGGTQTVSLTGTGAATGGGTTLQFEPEKLPYTTSGTTQVILSCSCFTDGYGTQINSTGVGQSVTYTLNVPTAGTYDVRVAVKKYPSRGIWQMSVNGTNVGTTWDEYYPSAQWAEFDVGNVTISATGNQAFKFTVVGKNPSSSGYTMTFDYIKLIPQ